MNEQQRIKELQEKVSEYEQLLDQITKGAKKSGVVVAGPINSLYNVLTSDGNVFIPAKGGPYKVGTKVLITKDVIVEKLHNDLEEKKAPPEFKKIGWNEIGGVKSQIQRIRDIIEIPYTHKNLYKEFNMEQPKGILLYGGPGVGKTLIAKAIASYILDKNKYAEDSFIYVKGPELLSQFVGNSEQRIRAIFDSCRRHQIKTGFQSVIFIDEAEAILNKRGSGISSDVSNTIVPAFLAEMDGFCGNGPFVILATNHPNRLDPAVIRDGRIDLKVEISRPTKEDSEEIFKIYLNKAKIVGDTTILATYSTQSLFSIDGIEDTISGAMIANVVKSASMHAIKRVIGGDSKNVGIMEQDLDKAIINQKISI